MSNKQAVMQAISVLSKSKSVVDAANLLNLSTRQLRRMFLDAGMLSPASYLPFTETGLTKSQKKRIRHLYSEFGGENTATEIAELLQIPVTYIQEYIKQYKITHSSLPLDEEELNNIDDSEKIKKLLEVKNYKIKAKLETLEAKRLATDADKWRTWEETVGTELFELLARTVPKYEVEKLDIPATGNPFSVIASIQDFHFGRLASSMEVNDDTDMDIQEKDLFEAVNRILFRIRGFGKPEALYLTVGADFLNSDNPQSKTSMGLTPQDSYPSHTVLQVRGTLLYIKLIDLLRQFFPKIFIIKCDGNHDKVASLSMYLFVCAFYRNCSDIITNFEDKNFRSRQYRKYGNSLLMFDHGEIPIKDIPSIILTEARELVGITTNIIYHSGHYHHLVVDRGNIVWVQGQSLAKEDRWHYSKGYQSKRGISVVLVDKETGYMAEVSS